MKEKQKEVRQEGKKNFMYFGIPFCPIYYKYKQHYLLFSILFHFKRVAIMCIGSFSTALETLAIIMTSQTKPNLLKKKQKKNQKTSSKLQAFKLPFHSPLIVYKDKNICKVSSNTQVQSRSFSSFCLFKTAPAVYGGSQTRGPFRAVAVGLHQSYSNTRSDAHLQTTPQLMAMPDP